MSTNTLGPNVTVSYQEYEAVVNDYAASEREVRRLRRHVTSLERELNESTSPENKKVRECCEHHAECWKRVFPRSKGLTYKMESTSAVAVRRALRLKFTVGEINSVTDYIFASEFHLQKRDWLMLDSYLADDRRIYKHLENIEKQQAAAMLIEREDRPDRLWPPVDRVLFELRRLGIEPRKADGTLLDERRVWLHEADCPLCRKGLLVGQNFETRWATVECVGGCALSRLLDALHLWPTDLTMPSDPEVVWAPLIENWRMPAMVHQLPPPGSPVLFEMAEAA